MVYSLLSHLLSVCSFICYKKLIIYTKHVRILSWNASKNPQCIRSGSIHIRLVAFPRLAGSRILQSTRCFWVSWKLRFRENPTESPLICSQTCIKQQTNLGKRCQKGKWKSLQNKLVHIQNVRDKWLSKSTLN